MNDSKFGDYADNNYPIQIKSKIKDILTSSVPYIDLQL